MKTTELVTQEPFSTIFPIQPEKQIEGLLPIAPPADGMQFARIAIMNLEQIKNNDTEGKKALETILAKVKERLAQDYGLSETGESKTPPPPSSCKYIIHGYYFAHDKRDVKRMESIGLNVTRLDDLRKTKPTVPKVEVA